MALGRLLIDLCSKRDATTRAAMNTFFERPVSDLLHRLDAAAEETLGHLPAPVLCALVLGADDSGAVDFGVRPLEPFSDAVGVGGDLLGELAKVAGIIAELKPPNDLFGWAMVTTWSGAGRHNRRERLTIVVSDWLPGRYRALSHAGGHEPRESVKVTGALLDALLTLLDMAR